MSADDDGPLLDTRLVPNYATTDGRTAADVAMDRLALVWSTRRVRLHDVGDLQAEVLLLCAEQPIAVVEIAAHMHRPVQIVRVLVSDLIGAGAVTVQEPAPYEDGLTNDQLTILLNGLEARL